MRISECVCGSGWVEWYGYGWGWQGGLGGGWWVTQTDGQPMRCILLVASMHPYRGCGGIFCSIWGVVGFIRFLCVQQQQQRQRQRRTEIMR